jgi:hypothetical protein
LVSDTIAAALYPLDTYSHRAWARALVQGVNAKFAFPRGITMGGAGDVLYLADTGNNCIRSVMLPSGHTQTFAGSSVKGLKDGVRALAAPHAALSVGPQ